jgi:hypothetical protein
MHKLACKLILSEPARFPVAAAHLAMIAAVKSDERRRKSKDGRKST